MKRRKRLPDGSLGELEKIFSGETEEERLDRLEQENAALQKENATLLFQGAMQDMNIQALQDENAEILFRLANIELGGIL